MKLLIVDDSKVMRSIIIRTLKAAGYGDAVFAEAGNGIEALKAMREGAIDLMLLDWKMRQRATAAGALFLVGKPFTPEAMQAAFAKAGI